MVVEDRIVGAILKEQFERFRKDNVLGLVSLTISDEELDEAAKQIGARSLTDARTVVVLHAFMRSIEELAKYN